MADDDRAWTAAQIKEFIQSLLAERDRAVEQADSERGKAATNLRIELSRSREEGDDRLREHISNQVQQISAALVSAEKLEQERMGRLQAIVDALAEKLEVLRQAQQLAQGKFESSVEGRFSQVNEFRGSLDDLSKQMATRRELEQAQAAVNGKIDELGKLITELRSRLDVGPAGLASLQTRADTQQGRQQGIGVSANAIATLISVGLVIFGLVASVYFGTH